MHMIKRNTKEIFKLKTVEELYLLHGKLSISFLQRKLRITFKHASKLLSDFNLKYFTIKQSK
jgi:hypothetical protein